MYLKLSDGGTVNLLSRSYGVYNINELGLQKCTSSPVDETDHSEKTYRCASQEMRIFGAIGSGASSVVQRALHIPTHRILALKKINIFEKVSISHHYLIFCCCLDIRSTLLILVVFMAIMYFGSIIDSQNLTKRVIFVVITVFICKCSCRAIFIHKE